VKIVCVGDCGIDHYLPGGEQHIGGITANVARHARDRFRADDSVTIVSCLGNDEAAVRVRNAFAGSGIECRWQERPGLTPVQTIEVQPDGERRFVRYEAGVLAAFEFSGPQRAAIRASDLLVAPVYVQIVDLFERLMAVPTRGRVAIDFADFLGHPDLTLLERHLGSIDIAFFGLSTAARPIIDRLGALASSHDTLFVITLGAAGSVAFQHGARWECPATPVKAVVDTTGAGDAYAAAFLAAYCAGAGVGEAMQTASRAAALVVGRSGSYPA
jgi:fructoselysine 6-kinase